MLRRLTLLFLILSFAVPVLKAQQGGTTTYVYDDDGRLIAVISPAGEASVYEYDPAGNFKAIKRLTANDLAILAFTPSQGPAGMSVTIFGTGFNQGVSAVSFNGTPANIVSSNLTAVVAVVPEGATTGPITVVTPRGTISSTRSFVIRGVRITPHAITVGSSESVQFGLTISGTATNDVLWSVNGVAGGNQSFGTITANGFYSAPNIAGTSTAQFTVRATSGDDAELFDEAVVVVVPFGAGFQFRSDGLSVRYGTPLNNPPAFINDSVSVRYGTPPNNPPAFINDSVSVRYGTPPNNPPAFINDSVSVRYGTLPNSPPTFVNDAVSATRGPVLSSLAPATLTRGTSISLTIQGVALQGATSIRFFNRTNGTPATGITVSNITVNGDGTSLTATITVASNSSTGSMVVVVTTPAGSTLRNDATSNLLQIN
ncbi:MAG TPA: IPT/TIG domain-containing protein [Pyrinomonadaceae bacterium]|nr:IPT/TIG domain-containing protein [Pyrinomonadaceae bacterium]